MMYIGYDGREYEDEDEDEGDGSGLHQCPYCYNLVTDGHEEFCELNPRNTALEAESMKTSYKVSLWKVSLWKDRLSAKPSYELTMAAYTQSQAASDAMKVVEVYSWDCIVVLSETTIVSYFDAEYHNGKFTFSMTETFLRHPLLLLNEQEQQ